MYVRDSTPVTFELKPFPPQPVSTVRWRGRGPGCPTITLVCNSISASKSKCGFGEWEGYVSTPPKFYLSYVRTQTGSHTWRQISYQPSGPPDFVCTGTVITDGDETRTSSLAEDFEQSYNSSCELETLVSTASSDDIDSISGTLCSSSTDLHCWTVPGCGGGGDTHTTTITATSTVKTTTDDFAGSNSPHYPTCLQCDHSGSIVKTETLSDEYTTELLKTNTGDALPDYAACFGCDGSSEDCSALISGQNCTCSAFRNLSTNETSYTIRRFKYKFKFPNPGTDGYLKILWNETFKPTLSAGVTYCGSTYATGAEDPNPAHWTTSAMSEIFGSGDTESSEHEVTEPSSNGTIYVTDIRWTKTEGCEPDASSIEGVDQFASNTSDTYLCNDRDLADKNCTCPE
jgi:hypothetical protein